ncbi:hypothetical protein OSG_eHPD7_00200 [environmental Halophage eHP-D7]|jgi:hypothetical protein|nr:hypothetical protein OSG_eHPD7_00200 [environmental Halophage eHP-D7]
MRLINTDTYEEIIKDVQTSPFAVSIDWNTDNIRYGLETLASEVKTENQSGNVFLMDNNMRAEMIESEIADERPTSFRSTFLGHQIVCDPDMIPERVLFIDPDFVALSGRILGIERIGVIDFSETETETDTDE